VVVPAERFPDGGWTTVKTMLKPARAFGRSFFDWTALAWLVPAFLVACALLTAGPRSAVDWRGLRAVALESDDWGLAGFVPSARVWDGLRREDLSPGGFPGVYWNSTLEDSTTVADLAALLALHRGRDGLPAVLQPNYVMSSLAWEDGRWHRYDLPDLPRKYQRPGLWAAVAAARRLGVWYPEFHAAWHYDPALRREATVTSAVAREAAARGIMLFPGSEAARELGSWRPIPVLALELDEALAVFERAFGRRPGSLIAPDYTWNGRVESLWSSRSLNVIQAKREQRHPDLPSGTIGRVLKVLERQWAKSTRAGRTYLERNCRLEPAQSPDPEATVVACVRETARAWRRGEPAIVETHRVNFAHADAAVVELGRRSLDTYLTRVAELPGSGPLFVADGEIASLSRHGTSVRRAGAAVVVRNGSHTRRIVAVEGGVVGPAGSQSLIILDAGWSGPWSPP
jgi:hypothetical protein